MRAQLLVEQLPRRSPCDDDAVRDRLLVRRERELVQRPLRMFEGERRRHPDHRIEQHRARDDAGCGELEREAPAETVSDDRYALDRALA
jgi:hypothetical protein